MNTPLFQGKLVRLVALDPELSAEAFARWSQDSEYLRLLSPWPVRPERADRIRDQINEKESKNDTFAFLIRALADDRLIGFISLDHVQWTHGDAWLGISIGEREYWGKGYGRRWDAIHMGILRTKWERNQAWGD